MAFVDVIFLWGASGSRGTETDTVPAGLPESAVRFWLRDLSVAVNDNAFRDLDVHPTDGTHGLECQLGLDLLAAGKSVAIIKCGKNSTGIVDWIPGSTNGDILLAEAAAAIAALAAAFPGKTPRYHCVTFIGGQEARAATEDSALAFGENYELSHGGIETLTGDTIRRTIVRTFINIPSGTWVDTVRAQQSAHADSLISTDDLAHVSNLHPTGASENTIGERVAVALLADIEASEAPMGTLSAYSLNGLMGLALGAVAFAPAATHYLAAFVAGTEVTGDGYERKAVTNNATNWPAAAARAKSLGVAQSFATATGGDWGNIDEIRVYDDPTAGNELARDDIDPIAITDGQTLVIDVGDFTITGLAGSVSDDLVEALLDHQFGSDDYTPEVSVEFAYYDGDPQGAGAEITGTSYARVVEDNDDVTWSAASSGLVRNLIDFSFPAAGAADWDEADYWALFDAAGTGLMFSAALPVARAIGDGETETIAAGRIRPSFS